MKRKVKRIKYFVGIDEAGRGPLAGPVAVGVVISKHRRPLAVLNGIKDSKKLSPKRRDDWVKIIKKNFKYSVCFASPAAIDKIGITRAVSKALNKAITKLLKIVKFNALNCHILLDGSLKAPEKYLQKTIIKGDEKIPLISAASIIAKTERDRKMFNLHKKFPDYKFNLHKGYGTKLHSEMIMKFGLLPCHRRSFCRKFHLSTIRT